MGSKMMSKEEKTYTREEVIKKGIELLSEMEIDLFDAQEWFDKWVKNIK